MKLMTEYLERAAHFQTLADVEADPNRKKQLRDQAETYLELASKRTRELGLAALALPF
jgi:hypothetical protein